MIRSADFVGIDDICRRTFATQNFLLGRIFANITTLSKRKCGRVVECTGLENRRRETDQGFESLSFRQIFKATVNPVREFESHRFRQRLQPQVFPAVFVFL